MIEVRLPIELWRRGEAVGLARARESRGGKPAFPYATTGHTSEESHVYGARGEAAFAHALGLSWTGPVNTFRDDPDVEPNWEVRTTPSEYTMKVAPDDKPGRYVAFVLNEWGSNLYTVLGYVRAGWAQERLPLVDKADAKGKARGKPAHWARRHQLAPIDIGFHALHSYMKDEAGRWVCAYCPHRYEEAS